MTRPILTLPTEEAEFLRDTYKHSKNLLEYGSGGSTVVAAETPNLSCVSVESDREWSENLSSWLNENVPGHRVLIHYSNIGRTGTWGKPEPYRLTMAPMYLQYPRSVWRRPGFQDPDTVLIDGRFRVACFLTVISKISSPARILFDDYQKRDRYKVVEEFFTPSNFIGRMAIFDVNPRPLSLREQVAYLKRRLNPR